MQKDLDHFIIGIPIKRGDKDRSVESLIRGWLDEQESEMPGKTPATSAQVKYLKRLGFKGKPELLSKEEASSEISRLEGSK